MKEFTGLIINGTYKLKDGTLEVVNDIEISDITPVELIGLLSVVVVNVLKGADKEKFNTFMKMFNKGFNHLVEEYCEDTNDK